MKSVQPIELLNALTPYLSTQGGLVDNSESIKFFYNCMMAVGAQMVNVCVYLNVIQATDTAVLTKLLDAGAWNTLYDWLAEYKQAEDTPLLTTLLQTFQRLPVTMEMLKANKSAKLIKALVKHNNKEIVSLAEDTVNKWMELIKASSGSTGSADKKERKKKKKEKTEVSKTPSIDYSEPIKSVESPPPAPIFKEKSNSQQKTQESSTTKQREMKLRNAGVDEGVIKPKPRGSKPVQQSNTTKPPLVKPPQSSHVISNSKRLSADEPATGAEKKARIDTDEEKDFGKVKIIAPRPKPAHIVQDSDGFMSALMTPTSTAKAKKKRPVHKSGPLSPTSPTVAPPSFYKDTLEGPSGVTSPSHNGNDRLSPIDSTASTNSDESKVTTEDGSEKSTDTKPAKKSVRWRPERELREIFYFEMLEDERVNVNRLRAEGDFNEMKKREMISDKEAVNQGFKHGQPVPNTAHSNTPQAITEIFPWITPELIEGLPDTKFEYGSNSKEKIVQADREGSVLAALYFTKVMIPSSASEPEREEDIMSISGGPPTRIPLEPVTADPVSQTTPEPAVAAVTVPETAATAALPDNVMDTINMLAAGQADRNLLQALANTNPTELDQMQELIQQQGLGSPNQFDQGFPQMSDQGFHGQIEQEHEPMDTGVHHHSHNNFGYQGNSNGFPPPNMRGGRGFRGGRFNSFRGNRGGFRGRGFHPGGGRGGSGLKRDGFCHFFEKHGHCNFGTSCKYSHGSPATS